MILITQKTLIADAASRWLAQIGRNKIYEKLLKLGPNATEKEINKIIGNTMWTQIYCDECKKWVDTAVELGEPVEQDSRTACVCLDCLDKASKLVGK